MSDSFPDYKYSVMDPPLPLNTHHRNAPRASPAVPRKPAPLPLAPKKDAAAAALSPDQVALQEMVPPPPRVAPSQPPAMTVTPPPDDSTDGSGSDYDDAASTYSGYCNVAPMVRHLHRKATKNNNEHYLKITDHGKKRQQNEKFLASISSKDLPSVARDIKEHPSLALSTDQKGVSALEKVVSSGDIELVQLFIEGCSDDMLNDILDHAILYAIRDDDLPLVKYFIKIQEQRQAGNKSGADNGMASSTEAAAANNNGDQPEPQVRFSMASKVITKIKQKKAAKKGNHDTWTRKQERVMMKYDDAEYSSFITPIVLAAKLQRVEIIRYLIETDNVEIHPLTESCPFPDCEICAPGEMKRSGCRSVEDSMRLLEIYRALASPAFISCTATDPILEAFKVSQAMIHMGKEDPAFKQEYEEISKQVQEFAVVLLQLCRSTIEINTMLCEEKEVHLINTAGHHATYPRILLALHYEQKEFVAHPHCQRMLEQMWNKDLPHWVCNSSLFGLGNILYIFLWLIGWLFLCLLFMLKVHPKLLHFMKLPYNRLISDNISFFLFLALLITNAVISNGGTDKQGRPPSWLEWLIVIWVLGMTCRLMKMVWRHRRNFFTAQAVCRIAKISFRWFDGILLLCFWVWIVLRITLYGIVWYQGTGDIPRYLWPSEHLYLVGEAFYAVGVILSVVRLNNLVQVSSSLGPLQISLKKMVGDILRFALIFFIMISAFALAITKVYSNYEGAVRLENGTVVGEQMDMFVGFKKTYKNLFWSLFGYPEVLDGGVIVVDNRHLNSTMQLNGPVMHDFTELLGLCLIGAYHCVAAIVMLNMLIAMMANSYNTIERNSDIEWKFARSKLRMMYQNEVGSLPPPLNITIIGSIIKGIQKLLGKCSRCCKHCIYEQNNKVDRCNYLKLIDKLYNRYWNYRQTRCHLRRDELKKLLQQLDENVANEQLSYVHT